MVDSGPSLIKIFLILGCFAFSRLQFQFPLGSYYRLTSWHRPLWRWGPAVDWRELRTHPTSCLLHSHPGFPRPRWDIHTALLGGLLAYLFNLDLNLSTLLLLENVNTWTLCSRLMASILLMSFWCCICSLGQSKDYQR